MRLLVSMGLRPRGRVEDPLVPRLIELDLDSGQVVREMGWDTPDEHRSDPASDQEFTSAEWWSPGVLLQPTHTEVLWIDTLRWTVEKVVSDPRMHGVHSAVPRPGGGFTVSAAGPQSVLEFDEKNQCVAHHYLPAGVFSEDFKDQADLRRCHHDAFKPHRFHPNHAVYLPDGLWVTCLETHSARSLDGDGEISLGGMAHDGRLREGCVWYTRVDGCVLGFDPVTRKEVARIELNTLLDSRRLLGWCRGIEVVGRRLFVGMSMLRRTRHREVLRWMTQGERGRKEPTRVLEVDLDERRVVNTWVLGNHAGGTIYGLNAIPED
jgi:hypothetical protein